MTKLYERIKYELSMLEADMKVQLDEIDKAKVAYKKDQSWYGEDADPGYLDSLYTYLHSTKDQIKLLNRILGDSIE